MNTDIIICTEAGGLERKSALLIDSIRRWGGVLRDCNIYSYAPRPGKRPSDDFYRFCERHAVTVVDAPLNQEFADYPLANKPLACAHREQASSAEYLLFLDSDTLIIHPFSAADLYAREFEVALNPVDYGRVATAPDFSGGEAAYWRDLYTALGVTTRRAVRTTVTRQAILEYYNSGFVLVKRNVGLFRAWEGNFRRVWEQGLQPAAGKFFVEQSVLSATIAQLQLRVAPLGRAVNFPVRNYLKKWRGFYPLSLKSKKHLHYHKIFDETGENVLAAKLAKLPHGAALNAAIEKYLFGALVEGYGELRSPKVQGRGMMDR